ncbi:MAG: hypothetical protein J3Q66DRAFT_369663 [Benniella sp.]|nr:MAG: hypothetical protein J3Q66DRAFT_369663 [Benniella sp.]
MTKISLLAALALASVCSALELFTDHDYEGDNCSIATPSGHCIMIPKPCYGQVSSMSYTPEWYCLLYANDDCAGDPGFIRRGDNIPSLGRFFDNKAKAIQCWTVDSGPYAIPNGTQ